MQETRKFVNHSLVSSRRKISLQNRFIFDANLNSIQEMNFKKVDWIMDLKCFHGFYVIARLIPIRKWLPLKRISNYRHLRKIYCSNFFNGFLENVEFLVEDQKFKLFVHPLQISSHFCLHFPHLISFQILWAKWQCHDSSINFLFWMCALFARKN